MEVEEKRFSRAGRSGRAAIFGVSLQIFGSLPQKLLLSFIVIEPHEVGPTLSSDGLYLGFGIGKLDSGRALGVGGNPGPTKQHPSTSLLNDVMFDILARLPKCDYPTLSLVSKHFQSLVKSPELYATRSLLGNTEACIYVVLENTYTNDHRFYILHRIANSNRLVLAQSPLPPLPFYLSFVATGSRVYAFGGNHGQERSSLVLSSHTVQHLPNMPILGTSTVASIIDGKIYVVSKKSMAVFDIETQMWEPEIRKLDMLNKLWRGTSVVMDGKMYIKDTRKSFVYDPKENKWETDKMLNSIDWRNACVIEDILYYYDYREDKLRAYDPKEKHWGVVKGVEIFIPGNKFPLRPRIVNYGGKLIVFLAFTGEIWCAEIALEKRQGIEIWGKVERCEVVFEGYVKLTDCIALMV